MTTCFLFALCKSAEARIEEGEAGLVIRKIIRSADHFEPQPLHFSGLGQCSSYNELQYIFFKYILYCKDKKIVWYSFNSFSSHNLHNIYKKRLTIFAT
jgi:hypothetical protein